MVLDHNLWMVIFMLQDTIYMNLLWNKIDYHAKTMTSKTGVPQKGDKYLIRLNKNVEEWTGVTQENKENKRNRPAAAGSKVWQGLPLL